MNDRDEVILETENVRVRILVLESGQATAWHFHTEVTDRMLCLEGWVAVEFLDPQESVDLNPGDRCEVTVKRVHRVVNRTSETAKYLLVQGVGQYDFNAVDEINL
ncbi:MAG: cupin domain-containing protein [Deltaproteobacteria bacterium]|nr:cupin domain-containing protein [Deltaproteobacteria bacterium]